MTFIKRMARMTGWCGYSWRCNLCFAIVSLGRVAGATAGIAVNLYVASKFGWI